MLEDILSAGLAEMGLKADSGTVSRFRVYYDYLSEMNKVMNLTAISGEDDSARLHFLDSAAPLCVLDFAGKSVIDVGTGAGFPGLPLKLLSPTIRLTLLDSLSKRVEFLTRLCGMLGLDGVECVHGRAEECGTRREKYDFAVSRAVARLNILSELCLPYVKPGGYFVALKGPAADEELAQASGGVSALGGEIERVFDYEIPGAELNHRAVIIRKVSPTPKKYPRRFALIKKSPL